ncbi:MAG: SPOR domain-containing protein [Kiloniellales bacterium]
MKRWAITIWLVVGAALTPSHGTAAADFEAGVQAYDLGDVAAAMAIFRPLAEAGHAAAAYNLGIIYSRGDTGVVDLEVAARWLRVAAERGLAAAQNRLGTMYFSGQGVTQDRAKAAMWIRRAAAQDDPIAQENLAQMYLKGAGVPQDYAEAEHWQRRANAHAINREQLPTGILREPVEGDPDRVPKPAAAEEQPLLAPLPSVATPPSAAAVEAPPPRAPVPPPPVVTPPSAAPPEVPPPATPPETAALATPEAGDGDGYMIQLVAHRTPAAAQATWSQLNRVHPDLLGGLPHRVERADLGRRGLFYRLRIGAFADRAAALKLCRDLKARRLDCWIVRQ